MVFYVFALQCVSTVRRGAARNQFMEVAPFQWAYMAFSRGLCLRHLSCGAGLGWG